MTRYTYAGGAADFVFDVAPTGYLRLRPASLLVWADEAGGDRITDLLVDGVPVTTIPVNDTGQVPAFEGPDGFTADLWVATAADKPRIRLRPQNNAPVDALATRIDGVQDHGAVSGAVELDSQVSTHWLDATAATVLTLTDGPDGGTRYVSVLVTSGAADVTVAGLDDVTLADATFATFAWVRGVWILAGAGGGGEAPVTDTTPPSAVTDLAVTPDDDGVTAVATFTPATDAESTVKYRYRLYEDGDTAPAWPTSGSQYNRTGSPINLTGLTAGTEYVMEIQAYSTGGSAAADSASFSTPIPPGWNPYDSLSSALIGADGARGTTADFITAGARTWQLVWSSGVTVTGGKITTTTPNNQTGEGQFVSGAPTGDMAVEFDYADLNTSGGYLSRLEVWFPQQTTFGFVVLTGERRLYCSSDVSGDQVVRTVEPTNPYSQLNGNTIDAIPAAARLRIERQGQLLKVYINGVLVMTGDYTACVYGGNPNPLLTTGGVRVRPQNHLKLTEFEWETYTS